MKYEKDLSVIIPYVGEFPQVLFTVQSVAQNLIESGIDFEIIAVNNYCDEAKQQGLDSATRAMNQLLSKIHNNDLRQKETTLEAICNFHKGIHATYEDRSGEALKACARVNPWLEYMEVTDQLSHWEAKRQAVEKSKGEYLLFVDAHTVPSYKAIPRMFQEYKYKYHEMHGSIHLPLTYKILESHRLIYKMKVENGFYGYSFTGFRQKYCSYEVPCMSTCGMMISREIYDKIGGWPKHMTMYGGGENYINYTLAVMGYKKWIYPHGTLFHHGDKRDYHYTYDGMLWNRMVAHYLFGGISVLKKYVDNVKGRPEVLESMQNKILNTYNDHRQLIKDQTVLTIDEWVKQQRAKEV